MKLNLKRLVAFLDDPAFGDSRDVSAITLVIGEDLNAAAFAHYIEKNGDCEVIVSSNSPTPGTRKGNRLDRWIQCNNKATGKKILYQTEIKNWAGSAIGGHRLPVECTKDEMRRVADLYWKQQIKGSFQSQKQPNGITKVLLPMKISEQHEQLELEPLLIYWVPISNTADKDPDPFFRVSIQNLNIQDTLARASFEYLNIFSVSIYLRQLLAEGISTLDFNLPNAQRRLKIFSEIIV